MEGRRHRLAEHRRGRHGPVDAGQRPPAALELPHRSDGDVRTIFLWLAAFRPQIKKKEGLTLLLFCSTYLELT